MRNVYRFLRHYSHAFLNLTLSPTFSYFSPNFLWYHPWQWRAYNWGHAPKVMLWLPAYYKRRMVRNTLAITLKISFIKRVYFLRTVTAPGRDWWFEVKICFYLNYSELIQNLYIIFFKLSSEITSSLLILRGRKQIFLTSKWSIYYLRYQLNPLRPLIQSFKWSPHIG
jgi:hypothetical protein